MDTLIKVTIYYITRIFPTTKINKVIIIAKYLFDIPQIRIIPALDRYASHILQYLLILYNLLDQNNEFLLLMSIKFIIINYQLKIKNSEKITFSALKLYEILDSKHYYTGPMSTTYIISF